MMNYYAYLFNIFFESQFEHLIGFIQYNRLQIGEVDVPPVDVIEDTASSPYKEIDASIKFSSLVFDGDSSVDSEDLVLIVMLLDAAELIGDLDCELTGRGKHDRLDATSSQEPILTKILYHWQTESKGLTRTSEISGNNVLAIVNGVETMLLDGE